MNIHEKYAKLGEATAAQEDRRGGKRVSDLLKLQEYYEMPAIKQLIALCRKDIVDVRLKLATTRTLSDAQRAELWLLIDSGELFLKMVAKDYTNELEQIDRQLEAELSR